MDVDRRFVTAEDGARLAYSLHGPGSADARERAVLVHSIGLDGTAWRRVVERLDRCHVLTVDCRGHGGSQRGGSPLSVELMADDVLRTMTDAGWDTAVVVGASMGGMVAQAVAAAAPARVSGLGLIDTTAWYGLDGARRWEERARVVEREGIESAVDFQLDRWFSPEFRTASPDVADQTVRTFLRTGTASFAATCRMMAAADLRDRSTSIVASTAIVVGEHDYATPREMAASLADSIAGSTLLEVPDVRHLAFIEDPDTVAGVVAELCHDAASS